ncbi:MAG: hypothetical protein NT038_04675 [Euryarchaeota archaeon]|nr:hypothetical protein [Euryarchaeota archaeon]
MKKMLALQITALLLVSGALGGMFVFTDVYTEIHARIVSVLCLSCIKLQPKIVREFTFNTTNNMSHPDFILDNLTKGPVFIEYSEDVCAACDTMHPVMEQLFNVHFEKQDMVVQTVQFHQLNVTFIYINIDHTTEKMRKTLPIFDKERIGGLPMFAIITIGNDTGNTKPYYTTLYGTLDLLTNEERINLLTEVLQESIDFYHQYEEGFHTEH